MNARIDLKRLGHLVALGEELNFSRAARRVHLSQTAFSRSIQAVEAAFGLRLFDRGTRVVRPTAAGRQVLGRARELLAAARGLEDDVRDIADALGGELAFGASQMAIDGVLRGVLPALMRERPRLRLDVRVNHWEALRQELEQERIELFVAFGEALEGNREFTVTPLAREAGSVFCRAGHPLAMAARRPRVHDVASFPWAIVQLPRAMGERLREVFAVPDGSPLPLAMRCDNQKLLLDAVLGTDTILLTWSSWLAEHVAQGTVVDLGKRLTPALPADLARPRCAVVRLARRTLSPAARRLVELIGSNGGRKTTLR